MKLPIESLVIRRFRGVRELELSGLGRINLFVGPNNSGKTSVLEAVATFANPLSPLEWIETVRRRDLLAPRAALIDGIKWLAPIEKPANGGAFSGTTEVLGEGAYRVARSTAKITEIEEIIDRKDDLARPETDSPLLSGDAGPEKGISLDLTATTRGEPDLFGAASAATETAHFELWESTRGRIPRNADAASLPCATVTSSGHRSEHTAVIEAYSEVVLHGKADEVTDLIRIFDPSVRALDIVKPRLGAPYLAVRHAALGTVPLHLFGDGMRRALYLGAMLSTARGGVLLVDEIETAIHVSALERTFDWLVRAAGEMDVQVFATTHSLEAVDALLGANEPDDSLVLHRLERRDPVTFVKRLSGDRLQRLRSELGQEIRG